MSQSLWNILREIAKVLDLQEGTEYMDHILCVEKKRCNWNQSYHAPSVTILKSGYVKILERLKEAKQ